MGQGMFRRACVAIVMIATLLLPYATCQSPARSAGHECCVQHTAPASLKANCCTVRSEVPAVVVEPAVFDSASFATVDSFALAAEPAVGFESAGPAAVVHTSPPPSKSILRI